MHLEVKCPGCGHMRSTVAECDRMAMKVNDIKSVWCCGGRIEIEWGWQLNERFPRLFATMIDRKDPPPQPLYSVGTWDTDRQGFTRDKRISVRSINVDKATLRQVLKELRHWGYDANRVRFDDGSRDSDPYVIVERTDGESYRSILERWKR